MAIVPIQGLWETHLTVADLDRSIAFYRDVVGLTLAHTVPERHAAFFWIGQPRQAMLGLWSIHTSPMAMRLHYAFQVTIDDVKASVAERKQPWQTKPFASRSMPRTCVTRTCRRTSCNVPKIALSTRSR